MRLVDILVPHEARRKLWDGTVTSAALAWAGLKESYDTTMDTLRQTVPTANQHAIAAGASAARSSIRLGYEGTPLNKGVSAAAFVGVAVAGAHLVHAQLQEPSPLEMAEPVSGDFVRHQ